MIYPVVYRLTLFVFLSFLRSNNRYNRLFRHGSFSTDADEVSKSAGAVKKRREQSPSSASQTDEQQIDGVDTVDNLPIETDDSNEKLGVVEETSENTDKLCISEDASLEFGKADSVPVTSSPIGPCPESTVEISKEVLDETNSVASSSNVSEMSVVEKTSLQRVRSVPALSSDDKREQESDVEPTGNFRRSYSLRERGSKKLQNLRIVTKAKSASDENLKEFERKKKEILGWEEEEARDSQDAQNFEKESFVEGARGSLPRDLHGVLESGFVKRHSRRFEEGVYDAPELDDAVDLTMPEEMDAECAPAEIDKITAEETQVEDESTPSEEPEPGLVKKHKEGYELKHRESLKRRALHQRGGSDEGKSAKREGDENEGVLDADADVNLLQTVEGLEGELRGVNVEALVKKVNHDMKKEVSVRRTSTSKKEQELREFVQKAGEQMKDALASGEDESSQKEKYSVTDKVDSEQIGEVSDTEYTKRKTRVLVLEEDAEELLLEDSQLTGSSSERRDATVSKRDTKSAAVNIELVKRSVVDNVSASVESTEKSNADGAETSEISETEEDREGGQDTEDVPLRGLVKRHTLLLEGKLQPLEQEVENEADNEGEKENGLTADREVGLCLSKGETSSEVADTEHAEENVEVETVEKITPERADVSEVSEQDKNDAGSEHDTENVPQKGLVKRHTLLLEGKLQPLDQELESNVEKVNGQDHELSVDQEACSSPLKGVTSSVTSDKEHAELAVAQSVSSGMEFTEKSISERAETSALAEDSKHGESEQDTENVPQKGLVKRHTLLIEGKLQPLDQELEKNIEKETGKESEPMVDQKACSSPSKGEESVAKNTEQAELSVAQGAIAVVKPEETCAAEREETSEFSEDRKDIGSEKDTENILQKGLVKRHTLLLEGRLMVDQELDKDVEKEDRKEGELTLDKEAFLPSSTDQEQLRYQIERTNDSTVEQCEEEEQDNEKVSGLVKREKLRIEERLQTTVVESKQELEDGSAAVDGVEEHCHEADKTEEGDVGEEQIEEEEEQSEIAVDTSSVVRVKEHTQHLECIIRVKQDVEKIKRQTSKDDDPKSRDEIPKFFIVPRSCSDESMDEGNDNKITAEKRSEDKMDVLSDSAVNIALLKAQENLDAEKENLELENENFVDWDAANVKQRRQIFEDMRRKGNEDSENKSNSLRRHESFPKMIHASEKPALRRRSVSDVTANVSSGSDREVGYTIIFKNKVVASSSSSSLPRDWSPLECRQRREDKGEIHLKEVFSPEIYRKDKLERNTSVELIKRQDKENETCLSVKETIQVLDSKNQRNVNNIS